MKMKIINNHIKIKHFNIKYNISLFSILLLLLFLKGIQGNNSTDYTCLSLLSSSVCTEWPNNFVSVSSKWTVSMLDNDLKSWKDSSWHINDFNNNYGCFWNGQGLQYLYTFTCFRMLFKKDNDCNSINRNTDKSRSNVIPICKTSCEAYYYSLKAIFNDNKQCPSNVESYIKTLKKRDYKRILDKNEESLVHLNENYIQEALSARTKTLQDINDYCNDYSTDDNCISDVVDERNYCGFSPNSINSFLEYCSDHSNVECCQNKLQDISLKKSSKLAISIWSIICILIHLPLMSIIFGFMHYKNRNLEKYMDPKLLNPDGLATFNKHIVIHPYNPIIEDEIKLNIGDIILIQDIFNDGWVHGINCTTNTEGTFPVACISPYELGNFNENSSVL